MEVSVCIWPVRRGVRRALSLNEGERAELVSREKH